MTATTVRDYLANAIQAAAPSWKVHPYPTTPDNVRRGSAVASVFRSDIEPGTTDLNLTHTVTVNLYLSATGGEDLEEDMEGHHDILLVALQRLPAFNWSKSSRVTWRDGTLAGWQITGTVTTPNIYRQAIQNESE